MSDLTSGARPSVPELLSVQRAARRLGIDPRQMRAAIRRGDLDTFQPGNRTRYVRWPDVIHWLRAHCSSSSNHARERAAEIISEEKQKETAAG